jgi:phosphatidylserine/phosphatidylglycerophosphate/cardiolipin synthase-like enzyme
VNRIFSNGPSKDFVFNPFTNLMHKATRLHVAAPYVTETKDLVEAAKSGTVINLLVGLNGSTSPQVLSLVHGVPNIAVRYLTHRFHAKIYIADSSALLGSSNLTDGGLRSNREATIYLDQPDDLESIEDIRGLFMELWDSANVLTSEILDKFTKKYDQLKHSGPDVDALIEAAVGRVEPANINVSSAKKTPERIFLEGLRRQIEEQYRPSFNEVTKVLEENNFRRPSLRPSGRLMRRTDFSTGCV